MGSLFNSLHIGYSGLNVSQLAIEATSHNVANADSDGYTRQRVVTSAATPLNSVKGNIGNGAEVTATERIFDDFVFDRYTKLSGDKEYSDYEKKTLNELSSYFPEVDGVGIKADMQEYYNMWQSFADNPDNASMKLALAKQTEILSDHIKQTQDQVLSLQSQINSELSTNIDEVNSLAKELAQLNKSIDAAEAAGGYTANDLRDKRNVIERDLSKLIGADVNSGKTTSDTQIDGTTKTSGSYTLSVNGFNIVDGSSYHPIHISNKDNAFGLYDISYERQDGTLIPMSEKISGGKIGAILELRGGAIDTTTGMPSDGILQGVVSELDAFASKLIESTNNLYAKASTNRMDSNTFVGVSDNTALVNSSLNIKTGTFDLVVYDIDGNETARKSITINSSTVMRGVPGSNSIQGQMEANSDDNGDGNLNNDIDNFIKFNLGNFINGDSSLSFTMNPQSEAKGYKFSIQDNLATTSFDSGTNFAGALGMNRFFDGKNARDIDLKSEFKVNSTLMSAGYTAVSGDNRLAMDAIQQQFEKYDFKMDGKTYNATMYGMYDIVATGVGTQTNGSKIRNDTITAQFNATEQEYSSVSKVNMDEEMANLIKYQTSYGAAAKVISTIDQMMQTLLGIKS
ncbi:flagellar hook-associated protein FlgK [Sulfurimonas sp.]|uniref:flagellar hook-associated protein FlgK n=1 Tax=Sulfurimonas sp. TaxID=2022749 RepID=UPI0025EF702D|nr:flagellar hook-associated protein FlgK [Sulfurimonas sp.]MDD5158397.1 flagellar hook-associated protein FlgK [Sulfurimonas sp.]